MSLVLSEVALLEHGPTITLTVEAGESLCVVGPAAAGKSKLLRMLTGRESPDRGQITRPEPVAIPEPCNRRARPQDLSHRRGSNQAVLATEVLSQLRLWDVRQLTVGELHASQIAACDLIELLMASPGLVVLDGNLDELDPWTRVGAMRLIQGKGTVLAASTRILELAAKFDHVIVLKDHQPVYAGRVSDLAATRGQRKLTIESERHVGVRALVEPLLVSVTQTKHGYELRPGPGQEQTARLLREGYGDVKFVVSDEKPVSELLLGLIES